MNESIEGVEELSTDKIADEAKDTLAEASATAKETLEQGKAYIQANQIPVLLGALAAGLVIGLLVPRKKPDPPTSMLENRIEELKDLLASLRTKVGATAGDQYDGLSSAIGSAVKKARGHFNLN